MGCVRDYREVIDRLQMLPRRAWHVEEAGRVWGYPFFRVRRITNPTVPTVFLSAGIHGEEPGSVEGALRWLESGAALQVHANWFVLPCINPYGWERNQRHNAQRRDVNRQFRDVTDCPEATLVKKLVRGQRFHFMLDLHEDIDATGYYLYELHNGSRVVGEQVLAKVSAVLPVNRNRVIDGRRATGLGLIRADGSPARFKRRRRWPMAYHMFLNCTSHVLGSETPVRFPLDIRARAHLAAIQTAVTELLPENS